MPSSRDIVLVGAWAGGIEALSTIVDALPVDGYRGRAAHLAAPVALTARAFPSDDGESGRLVLLAADQTPPGTP